MEKTTSLPEAGQVEPPFLDSASTSTSHSSSIFDTGEAMSSVTSKTSLLSVMTEAGAVAEPASESAQESIEDATPIAERKSLQKRTGEAAPAAETENTQEPKPTEDPTPIAETESQGPKAAVSKSKEGLSLPLGDVDVVEISDDEAFAQRFRIAGSMYNPYAPLPSAKALKSQIENAPKQLSQIFQYSKLMEMRMQTLEQKVRELKGKKSSSNAPEASDDTASESSNAPEASNDTASEHEEKPNGRFAPALIPQIRRQGWSDFLQSYARETHPIEILYGEPNDTVVHINKRSTTESDKKVQGIAHKGTDAVPYEQSAAGNTAITQEPISGTTTIKPANTAPALAAEGLASTKTTQQSHDKAERLTRICIVSQFLREELRKVTGYEIYIDSSEILEPFDPLISYEKQIRENQIALVERLAKLREEEARMIEELKKTASEDSVADTSTTEAKPSESNACTLTESKPIDKDFKSSLLHPLAAPVFAKTIDDLFFDRSYGFERSCSFYVRGLLMVEFNIPEAQIPIRISENGTDNGYLERLEQTLREEQTNEERQVYKRRAEIYKTSVLIEEWKLLVLLLDEDLSKLIKLRNTVQTGGLDEVPFNDLCYLFKPGDMVVADNDKQQLWQVFSVVGGRRLLVEKDPDSSTDQEEKVPETAEEVAFAALGGFLHSTEQYSPLIVDCFHYDFNGIHIGAVQQTFKIKRYKGKMKVKQLTVYPVNFDPQDSETDKTLVERGRKFMTLCAVNKIAVHKQYSGLSFDDPPDEIDSPIILDADMASRIPLDQQPRGQGWVPKLGVQGPTPMNEMEVTECVIQNHENKCSNERCKKCPWNSSPILNDNMKSQELTKQFAKNSLLLTEPPIQEADMQDKDFALLPCRVFGFVLRSRRWARLNIDHITDIDQKANNFENLVLPKGHKKIVQALVETHFKKETKESERHSVDLVRGKGKGLIILLHGAPGVGKTSTAECVAEHTGRPLFSITCGDIGETAEDVERNLDRCFQMAHKWGCVLLLDEADVFMAKRDRSDLRRNALVSVFLRVLEYYAGILFLTTNRVGTFDAAFRSRIHMSLGYPSLNYKSTREIWKMNIKRTQEFFQDRLEIKEDEILKFAMKHFNRTIAEGGDASAWNGRQIRNAFQTAIALAQWEVVQNKSAKPATLGYESFKQVAKASSAFDSYLKETHGGVDEAERALNDQDRADTYFSPRPTPSSEARPKSNQNYPSGGSRTTRKTQKASNTPSKMNAKYATSDGFSGSDPGSESASELSD